MKFIKLVVLLFMLVMASAMPTSARDISIRMIENEDF